MATSVVATPTSRLRVGLARCDITPPADTYHRMWGAAAHDRAEGVHRPLTATALVIEPRAGGDAGADAEGSGRAGVGASAPPSVGSDSYTIFALDHCLFRPPEMDDVRHRTAGRLGVPSDSLIFTFSHTHSGGYFSRDRANLPGGERIGPYLDALPERLAAAGKAAAEAVAPAVLTYGFSTCAMAHNRDYPDPGRGIWVCGFNPEEPAGMPVGVVRIARETGESIATIVNYPCHPTTLAWENRLVSPDYVGALREAVENACAGPCLFLLAPCGDVGPRVGYVGDTEVADRNGRIVGHAASSVLESLPPSGHDFHYAGPVFSGATLGMWEHRPHSIERIDQTARFVHQRLEIPLPYLAGMPTLAQAEEELAAASAREESLRAAGDADAARDARALAERKRRLIERLRPLPEGATYPYVVDLWRLGDAWWIAVEGEPYHALQSELQRRFPGTPMIFAVLSNGARPSYLPERHDYGKPLYQADIALLAPGCLERIIDAISSEIRSAEMP